MAVFRYLHIPEVLLRILVGVIEKDSPKGTKRDLEGGFVLHAHVHRWTIVGHQETRRWHRNVVITIEITEWRWF